MKLARDDTYMLASMACDVDVIQLVDGKVGVRVPIPSTAVNGLVLLAMLAFVLNPVAGMAG